jgi:hypothetical protein
MRRVNGKTREKILQESKAHKSVILLARRFEQSGFD